MKIVDLHADIGNDIFHKSKTEQHIFVRHHVAKLKQGDIDCTAVACFFCGEEDWLTMQETVLAARKDLLSDTDQVQLVLTKEDLNSELTKAIITVEGMCGICDDVEEKIAWLYEQGVRIGSLCWNDENALASGVGAGVTRGLTELGKKAIATMNELNMIVDVSHANEATFWDILKVSQKPIVATHSNTRELCGAERNLTNQQLKAIATQGGLIGLNAARNFIDSESLLQDATHLAKHARHMANLVGVEHIAIGFDFMDFLADAGSDKMAMDLQNASQAQNLVKALAHVGFDERQIEMICRRNATEFLMKWL